MLNQRLTPPPAPPPPRRSAGPLVVAVALVLVAAGLAVWGLVALLGANDDRENAEQALARAEAEKPDEKLVLADARDEVSKAAQEAVAVMNTLDYRTLDEDLEAWAEVTTGDLRDEVTSLDDTQRQQIVDARSVTEGRTLRVAVRELDVAEGAATALVAVETTRSVDGSGATPTFQRIEAELTRTDDGWKLSALSQVPYVEPSR